MSEKVTENDAAVREQAIASLLELVLDFKDNDTTGAQCDDDLLNASIAFAIHGYEIQACCDAISKISLECQNKMIETLDNVRQDNKKYILIKEAVKRALQYRRAIKKHDVSNDNASYQ